MKSKITSNLALSLALISSPIAANADLSPSTANAPWVETFTQGGKSVVYVGAVHHSPVLYPTASADPIFETVTEEFNLLQPDAVIIEGVDPKDLQGYLQYAKNCAAANYNLSGDICDEPELTTVLALNAGIPVVTGEPTGASVVSYFESQGYTVQDLLSYYVMRDIPVQNNHALLTPSNFEAFVQKLIQASEQDLGINVPYTATDFENWYAANMPSPANYLDISTNDTGPSSVNGGPLTLLNKFSVVDLAMRDAGVIAAIQKNLIIYDRILVVYGASHLVFEWNQLEQMLGSPAFSKPY